MPPKEESDLLAISHRNLEDNDGGIESCIRREISVAVKRGIRYNLATPLVLNEEFDSVRPYSILLATYSGNTTDVVRRVVPSTSVNRWLANGSVKKIVIHSPIGHSLSWIYYVLLSARSASIPTKYFVHDFSFACTSCHLIRDYPNDKNYCNVLEIGDSICEMCSHGKRRRFYQRIIFGILRASGSIVCPSPFMKRNLLQIAQMHGVTLESKVYVVSHYSFYRPRRVEAFACFPDPSEQSAIVLAFYGSPAAHKGWHVFEHLAVELSDYPYLRFLCMCSNDPESPEITWIPFSARNGDSLKSLASKYAVNAFFFWNSIPEPYGLSFHEACATGMTVFCNSNNLTNRAHQCATFQNIREMAALDEIRDLLKSESMLRGAIRHYRGFAWEIRLSDMSLA